MSTVVSSCEPLLRPIVFTRPIRVADPPSWVPHIPFAFWLIDALRPGTVVELGTHTGVSYSAFAQAVQMLGLDTAAYAVDTWKGDHQAGFYDEDVFTEWSSFHDHHFGAFSRLVRSTFDEALSKFPDGSVDLLHIDGLHTYEAVRHDFESWLPKLSPRAVVLMHDTNVREADFGVWRFWAEVAARYPSFAFLHGHGLGVVGVGRSLTADVRWLVDDVTSRGQIAFTVRGFFATLGEALLRQRRESAQGSEWAQMVGRLAEQDALLARLTAEATPLSKGAGDRTQVLERELEALRQDTRTAQHQTDVEHARAERLQDEIAGLQRRLESANERGARLNRKWLKLRLTTSRLTRNQAAQALQRRKLERALQQVYNSRSWRWTAPLRRAPRIAAGLGLSSFTGRNVRVWVHATRMLLSPSRLRNVREIARCGLFDKAFYLRTYPDVGRTGISPLVHYALIGAREGRRPHPLFDGKYYLARNADVRESGANPLLHFVRHGAALVRDPHPLFSTRYYLAANPDIGATGLDPLSHYMTFGSQNGLTPHPLFDPAFYLDRYPDVPASGVNPLAHFVEHGARDGRSPHPLFDAKFYLRECGDSPRVSVNPLLHYLETGREESHDPHPLFQDSFYRRRAPELQHLGITPLQHFVEWGVHEGRRPNPFFDPIWYLQTYPNVAMSGQNPLAYYATQGWKEGHDPSPRFSTTYYLQANPELEAAGMCPLEHYLRGRREDRRPQKGAKPDDPFVPDAPPPVTLKVHPAHARQGRLGPDTAAGPPVNTIICLSHVVPWPPRAGNEFRIHRMLVRLRRSGYRIVLVMSPLSPQTIEDAQWEELAAAYGNVVHCERDGRVRHRLDECPDVLAPLDGQRTQNYAALLDEVRPMPVTSRQLLQIDRRFCHDSLIATLVHLQSSLQPCAVIAEYIWMTRGLPLLDPGVLTLVDTIDAFSTFHEKVGAFGVAGWDVPPEEEAGRLARAQVIVAIQPEEAQILGALAPDREVLTVGVDFDVVEHTDWPPDPIVFCVGSDNSRNMLGLRDFLKFAWPEIRRSVPDARLEVAGSVGAAVPDYAQGVHVLGHVEDLDRFYLRARVVVNPAVAGTGLKIKTVEALSRLRPIVTWPNGVEGLPAGMAALVPPAEDWFDFAERVITWLRARTPAFDAATAASIRHMLSADHVYGEVEARLARFFNADRSQKR